jgi:hypothetical protein
MKTPLLLFLPLLCACAATNSVKVSPRSDLPSAQLEVTQTPLAATKSCGSSFVAHNLQHTTTLRQGERLVYDSNGSGLVVADFDRDGYSDIVLGNLAGVLSVQWNKKNFIFERQALENSLGIPQLETRDVVALDFNADGWMDFATTNTRGGVSLWLNQKNKSFVQTGLEGVTTPAYTMLWTDFDQDGDVAERFVYAFKRRGRGLIHEYRRSFSGNNPEQNIANACHDLIRYQCRWTARTDCWQ